jgi:hypothetical protein
MGACRDVSEAEALAFPVYARVSVPASARGRLRQRSTGEPVIVAGVSVEPGDVVIADTNSTSSASTAESTPPNSNSTTYRDGDADGAPTSPRNSATTENSSAPHANALLTSTKNSTHSSNSSTLHRRSRNPLRHAHINS